MSIPEIASEAIPEPVPYHQLCSFSFSQMASVCSGFWPITRGAMPSTIFVTASVASGKYAQASPQPTRPSVSVIRTRQTDRNRL